MRGEEFICAELARIAYNDGGQEGLNGAMAVAFGIRDRVRAGWHGGNWIEVLSAHQNYSATSDPLPAILPDPRRPTFQALLQEINGIFSGATPNTITLPMDALSGAITFGGLTVAQQPPLYWGYLNAINSDWFRENILYTDKHRVCATVGGGLTFWT